MDLPQIRHWRMLLKGTQFPLLQALAEPGTGKTFRKNRQDTGIIHKSKSYCHFS
jgi:hypothetical protein